LLRDPAPAELGRPIAQGQAHTRAYSEPTSLLNVKVDGRRTYFEWINAGHYAATGSRGSMSMVQEGRLAGLHYGFDPQRLLLRFDARGGPVRERLADVDTLRIVFYQPAGFELLISRPSWQQPIVQLYHDDVAVAESGAQAAADQILELSLPLASMALDTEDLVHFHVEVLIDEQSAERLPFEGAIETSVPSPEFELMMWQA